MKKILIVLAVILIAVFGWLALKPANNPSADSDTIKIGVYLPITGANAAGGELELDGVKLAYEQQKEVLGKKIELVIVDNKSDKVEAANAVKRLVSKDKVNAIVGSYGSSLAMAGGDVAEKAGIPMVGTSCTNQMVTQGKKYSFRVCFIDPFQGAGASEYALSELNAKTAACLIEVTTDYSVGLASFFEDHFTKHGGRVVAKLNYQSGDQDFTAQLTEIISKNPDVLYIPANFAEAAIIIRQARELGAKFQILGGDATDNPEMTKIAGAASEGYSFTTFAYAKEMPNMNDTQKAFTESWSKLYKDKDPNALAACGYDAYSIIIDAIKRAGSAEPEKIQEALAKTVDFEGVTGKTTINETHDAEKSIGIVRIKGGNREFFKVVDPK